MSRVCVIPARGGSQRIPRKNCREFHGKPIICYSIQAAIDSRLFDKIYVSTDDAEIGAVAELAGAIPLRRSNEMSENHVGTQQVMENTLFVHLRHEWHDVACCLYPTAPMLHADTLKRAAAMLTEGTPYVVPVGEWLQDPGQFYFGWSNAFTFRAKLNASGTKICWVDPATCCDINTEEDWLRAERMYAKLNNIQWEPAA